MVVTVDVRGGTPPEGLRNLGEPGTEWSKETEEVVTVFSVKGSWSFLVISMGAEVEWKTDVPEANWVISCEPRELLAELKGEDEEEEGGEGS